MKFANIINCIYKEFKEPDHNEEGTESEGQEARQGKLLSRQ